MRKGRRLVLLPDPGARKCHITGNMVGHRFTSRKTVFKGTGMTTTRLD